MRSQSQRLACGAGHCNIGSAALTESQVLGATGFNMSGPYAYTAPSYFAQVDDMHWTSFLSEGGPGASPMLLSSWRRVAPPGARWDANLSEPWNSDEFRAHCANPQGLFGSLRFFAPPLYERYGAPRCGAADFFAKAQLQAFESQRAMFETYGASPRATGLIQWMLQSSYPSHMWNVYSYDLQAGGSYYGLKRALAGVKPLLWLSDNTVRVLNWSPDVIGGREAAPTTVYADVYAIDTSSGTVQRIVKMAHELAAALQPLDATSALFALPPIVTSEPVVLVRLRLVVGGTELPPNDYWLSTTSQDQYAFDQQNFYRTPQTSYANLSPLSLLPPVVNLTATRIGERGVRIENPSDRLAFGVRIDAGDDLVPQVWSDNYIVLLPRERRTLELETLPLANTPESSLLDKGIRIVQLATDVHC